MTEAFRVQLDTLTTQNEALHLHVLGKDNYMQAMERQINQLKSAIKISSAAPRHESTTHTLSIIQANKEVLLPPANTSQQTQTALLAKNVQTDPSVLASRDI